jgi:hypothetical protein
MRGSRKVLAVLVAVGVLLIPTSALGAEATPKPGKWVGTTSQFLPIGPVKFPFSSKVSFSLKRVGATKYKLRNFRTAVQTYFRLPSGATNLCRAPGQDPFSTPLKTPIRLKATVKNGSFSARDKGKATNSAGSEVTTLEAVRGSFRSKSKVGGWVSFTWNDPMFGCRSGKVSWRAHRA